MEISIINALNVTNDKKVFDLTLVLTAFRYTDVMILSSLCYQIQRPKTIKVLKDASSCIDAVIPALTAGEEVVRTEQHDKLSSID